MTKSDWLAHLHPSLPSDWPVILHALPHHLIGWLTCILPHHLIGRLSCILSYHLIGQFFCMLFLTIYLDGSLACSLLPLLSLHFVLLLLLLLNYHRRFKNQHSDAQMLAILQPQGSWIPLVVKTDLCSSLMGKWVPPFLGEGII